MQLMKMPISATIAAIGILYLIMLFGCSSVLTTISEGKI